VPGDGGKRQEVYNQKPHSGKKRGPATTFDRTKNTKAEKNGIFKQASGEAKWVLKKKK